MQSLLKSDAAALKGVGRDVGNGPTQIRKNAIHFAMGGPQ